MNKLLPILVLLLMCNASVAVVGQPIYKNRFTTTPDANAVSASTLISANASTLFGSGTMPTARLGSGTANNTSFLRGDQTWVVGSSIFQPLNANLTTIGGLVDPNADRILFWDDSAGAYAYLTLGTGLSITGTTINAAAGGSQTPLLQDVDAAGFSINNVGNISGNGSTVTSLTAANITAGGTLPALNGAALTALTAGNITAGGTLPALNGSALTALAAANITAGGTLPALNGSAVTGIPLISITTNGLVNPVAGQVVTVKADGTLTVSNAAAGGTGFIADANGFGTNTTLTSGTNYGSVGRTNWTYMDASGLHNTNTGGANMGVDISSGGVTVQSAGLVGFKNSIGVTITPYWWISNSATAALGAPQASGAFMLGGQAWKTTPSTSTNVAMGLYTLPIQGAAAPTAALHFLKQIGSENPVSIANITSAGALSTSAGITAGGAITSGGSVIVAAASTLSFSGANRIWSPKDGYLSFVNSSGLGFETLVFGSFVANTLNEGLASTNYPALHVESVTNYPALGVRLGTNITAGVYGSLFVSNLTASASVSATNGVASFSTIAAATIDATGWTNTLGVNATVYVTATAVSFVIKNRAQTTLYTSPTLTATMPVNLQPGWAITAVSGLAGTALPF